MERNKFIKELSNFNKEKLSAPLFTPEIYVDEDSTCLNVYSDTDKCIAYIEGQISPFTGVLEINRDFYDKTHHHGAFLYLEYLCEKYEGTFVGVYANKYGLYPVKIIKGMRRNGRLAILDREDDE